MFGTPHSSLRAQRKGIQAKLGDLKSTASAVRSAHPEFGPLTSRLDTLCSDLEQLIESLEREKRRDRGRGPRKSTERDLAYKQRIALATRKVEGFATAFDAEFAAKNREFQNIARGVAEDIAELDSRARNGKGRERELEESGLERLRGEQGDNQSLCWREGKRRERGGKAVVDPEAGLLEQREVLVEELTRMKVEENEEEEVDEEQKEEEHKEEEEEEEEKVEEVGASKSNGTEGLAREAREREQKEEESRRSRRNEEEHPPLERAPAPPLIPPTATGGRTCIDRASNALSSQLLAMQPPMLQRARRREETVSRAAATTVSAAAPAAATATAITAGMTSSRPRSYIQTFLGSSSTRATLARASTATGSGKTLPIPIDVINALPIFEATTTTGKGTCSICLELLGESAGKRARVLSLPCSHKFHEQCIRRWLNKYSGACPACRLDVAGVVLREHDRQINK